jgi:hypothetical protein
MQKYRTIPLSLPRRLILEHCHFSNATTKGVMKRTLLVAEFTQAMAAKRPAKVPVTVLFLKAFAFVARDMPELRRSYVRIPTPRLMETAIASGCIAITRDFQGTEAVLLAQFANPAAAPLSHLADDLMHYKNAPVEQIRDFKRSFQIARLPQPLRRFAFWLGLNWPRQRRKFFANFAVSNTGDAEPVHAVHPLTALISFGRIDSLAGRVDATISFDHRVFDGMTATRALVALEAALNGAIAAELLSAPDADPKKVDRSGKTR